MNDCNKEIIIISLNGCIIFYGIERRAATSAFLHSFFIFGSILANVAIEFWITRCHLFATWLMIDFLNELLIVM